MYVGWLRVGDGLAWRMFVNENLSNFSGTIAHVDGVVQMKQPSSILHCEESQCRFGFTPKHA